MRRKLAALLGAAALLASAPVASAATPSAASGEVGINALGDCPSTYACFWVHSGYRGTMGKVAGNNTNFMNLSNSSGCTAYPGTWNDCVSSIANRGTQCTVYFFTNAGYGGRWHSLSRGDEVADFATGYNDPAFNDAISSNRWCSLP
ncbi:peptidase inhibitor family I36 protein [Streptomyces sp. SA15]|uniref:peptidase inhibitor family I36 protein n=1 Tax=Streptomyces sp. SA15 TaxID=934019 RepID=UPI0015C79ECE|nr:peptidase inhibitor family I36 protein [Streptomyces sp. SA15]